MKIEHFAINVHEPHAMADWYAANFGFEILRKDETPPYITFVGDDGNGTLIEFYANPNGEILDYGQLSFFTFHLAFAVDDLQAEIDRLTAAGATQDGEWITMPNGDVFAILRCPWGIALQVIKRVKPFI